MNRTEALAQALLQARAHAATLPCPSAEPQGLTLDQAYQVADRIEAQRTAAGEHPRGWKIGFTNRGLWARYGVDSPIWGRVWDRTLMLLEGDEATVSLAGLVEPRLEPEIVFGFAEDPQPGQTLDELQRSLAWVAHGVEIVHTHYPGWQFGHAADTVADFGLHGRLLVGPRRPVQGWPGLADDLVRLELGLDRQGAEVDRGRGDAVLDGPLQTLGQWLAALPRLQPLARCVAGDVVTTGTLTDAWPVEPGQTWRTRLSDDRLSGLRLHFTA